jgi:hypothetical protein
MLEAVGCTQGSPLAPHAKFLIYYWIRLTFQKFLNTDREYQIFKIDKIYWNDHSLESS